MPALPSFDWRMPTRLAVRPGGSSAVGPETAALGTRALVVSDPGCYAAGFVDDIGQHLTASGVVSSFVLIDGPTDRTVARLVQCIVESSVDVVVAVGGGSVMDPSKVAALSVRNGELSRGFGSEIIDLDRTQLRPAVPVVCVPTTPATGSEANGVALLLSGGTPTLLHGGELVPTTAVVDVTNMVSVGDRKLSIASFEVLCRLMVPWVAAPAVGAVDDLSHCLLRRAAELVLVPALNETYTVDDVTDLWALSMLSATGVTGLGRSPAAQTLWYLYAACLASDPRLSKGEILAGLFSTYVDEIERASTVGRWLGARDRLASALLAASIEHPQRWLRSANLPVDLTDLGLGINDPEQLAKAALRWIGPEPQRTLDRKDLTSFFRQAQSASHRFGCEPAELATAGQDI